MRIKTILIGLGLLLAVSSCAYKTCPTYMKANPDTVKTETAKV